MNKLKVSLQQEVKRLRDEGLSNNDVAIKLGLRSPQLASYHFKRANNPHFTAQLEPIEDSVEDSTKEPSTREGSIKEPVFVPIRTKQVNQKKRGRPPKEEPTQPVVLIQPESTASSKRIEELEAQLAALTIQLQSLTLVENQQGPNSLIAQPIPNGLVVQPIPTGLTSLTSLTGLTGLTTQLSPNGSVVQPTDQNSHFSTEAAEFAEFETEVNWANNPFSLSARAWRAINQPEEEVFLRELTEIATNPRTPGELAEQITWLENHYDPNFQGDLDWDDGSELDQEREEEAQLYDDEAVDRVLQQKAMKDKD
jgi:hypothetical protein